MVAKAVAGCAADGQHSAILVRAGIARVRRLATTETAMRRGVISLLLWVAACFTGSACAATETWVEHAEWADEFAGRNVRGTALVYDEAATTWHVHDRQRAETRFLPASTFKIFNALTALETGVVQDEHEVIRWDGVQRDIADWNRDHDLASGMRYSVVWFYQAIARRIGAGRMQAWIDRVGYGNRDIGGGIDRFWLSGNLRVSAVEQVGFLRRLAAGSLPFSARSQDIVRRLLIVDRGPDWTLRAKTGWKHHAGEPDYGWYVGWVERDARRWLFAVQIDMPQAGADAPKRIAIARHVLASVGALPPE